jgi:hypothetical protein
LAAAKSAGAYPVKINWELENAILAPAPAWVVWQVLTDVLHWPGKSISGSCLYGSEIGPQKKFAYMLAPLGLSVRVQAQVTSFKPLQQLGWKGKFWGVNSQVKINLSIENSNATRLSYVENLSGWGLILLTILIPMKKLIQINQRWLEELALKAHARFMGNSAPNPQARLEANPTHKPTT